jgi:hypothetical protein
MTSSVPHPSVLVSALANIFSPASIHSVPLSIQKPSFTTSNSEFSCRPHFSRLDPLLCLTRRPSPDGTSQRKCFADMDAQEHLKHKLEFYIKITPIIIPRLTYTSDLFVKFLMIVPTYQPLLFLKLCLSSPPSFSQLLSQAPLQRR